MYDLVMLARSALNAAEVGARRGAGDEIYFEAEGAGSFGAHCCVFLTIRILSSLPYLPYH
jgi:hypothetical protein